MTAYYFDWCPRASDSILINVACGTVSARAIFGSSSDATDEVPYWIRSDGIFVFAVPWLDVESLHGVEDRLTEAYLISGLIKEQEHHCHFFDFDRQRREEESFPTLAIGPVELSNDSSEVTDWDSLLADNRRLAALQAPALGARRTGSLPAVVLYRGQFARVFDKAQIIRKTIREKSKRIPILNLEFPIYNYKPTLIGYIICVVIVSIVVILIRTSENSFIEGENISISLNIKISDLLDDIWRNCLALSLPALGVVYALVIRGRRGKVIRSLRKAKGFLLFGTIFDQVSDNMLRTLPYYTGGNIGFEKGVEILNTIEIEEKQKSLNNKILMALIFLVSFEELATTIATIGPTFKSMVEKLSFVTQILY